MEATALLSAHPDLLGPVREALQRLEELPSNADWGTVRDADLAFHAALVGAMGRPRTSAVFESILGELRLAFRQLQEELEDRDEVCRQHRRITETIARGDRDAVVAEIRSHLDDATDNICRALAQERGHDT